jgi:ABC-type glycerol-3-phosphate transport system permease component
MALVSLRGLLWRTARVTVCAVVVAFFAMPLLIVVSAALRDREELFRYSTDLSLWTFLPRDPTLDTLEQVISNDLLRQQIFNTVFLGLTLATATVVLAVLAGYALARMQFPGRTLLFVVLLGSTLLPLNAVILPLFLVVRDIGLLDSFWALFLPFVVNPLAIYLMRQAILNVPRDLEEAVFVEGGGLLAALRHAILPNVRPAMVTAWMFAFLLAWDAYLWPLVVTQDPDKQLVQVGVQSVASTRQGVQVLYELLFAGCLLALVPAALLLVIIQRVYVRGSAMEGLR